VSPAGFPGDAAAGEAWAKVREVRQLWAPWRMTYVSGEEPSPDGCFLCAAGEAPDPNPWLVVERGEATLTLMNRFPYSSGHVMVAPRRHAVDFGNLSPEEGAQLVAATQRAIRAIDQVMQPGGFNVGLNLGHAAGASIDHLHLHVVPRWGSDTNFMPVLADVKVLPEHLEVTAARLREAIGASR
jgi:ATP adenylyltransferase